MTRHEIEVENARKRLEDAILRYGHHAQMHGQLVCAGSRAVGASKKTVDAAWDIVSDEIERLLETSSLET